MYSLMNWLLYLVNLTSVFSRNKDLFSFICFKKWAKTSQNWHVSRQKLLQQAKACKNTSGNHRIAMQLVLILLLIRSVSIASVSIVTTKNPLFTIILILPTYWHRCILRYVTIVSFMCYFILSSSHILIIQQYQHNTT